MTGKDITVILTLNNTAIASTRIRSNDINTSCDAIERASATQQEWTEHIAGRKSWTLSISYLVLAHAQSANLLYVGQTFGITIAYKNGDITTNLLTGTAIMTAVKQTSTIGNLCKGSFSLRGSGPLSVPT